MSKNLIDIELLEKLQKHFRRANDVYLACMDRERSLITRSHASSEEIDYIKRIIPDEAITRLLDKIGRAHV